MTADWLDLLVLASLLLLVGLCVLVIYSEYKWLTSYEQAHAAMQRGLEMPHEGLERASRDGSGSTTRPYADATAGRRATAARYR